MNTTIHLNELYTLSIDEQYALQYQFKKKKFSVPTASPLSEQPHPMYNRLTAVPTSVPGSYTNPWPEVDEHHKEGQLHPMLRAQKPSVLPN